MVKCELHLSSVMSLVEVCKYIVVKEAMIHCLCGFSSSLSVQLYIK